MVGHGNTLNDAQADTVYNMHRFVRDAAEIFQHMRWTWYRNGSYIVPEEYELRTTTMSLLQSAVRNSTNMEIGEVRYASSGRISVYVFRFEDEYEIHLTLEWH